MYLFYDGMWLIRRLEDPHKGMKQKNPWAAHFFNEVKELIPQSFDPTLHASPFMSYTEYAY